MNLILHKNVHKTWFNLRDDMGFGCEADASEWTIRIKKAGCPVPNTPETKAMGSCNVRFLFAPCGSKAPKVDPATVIEYDVLDVQPGRFAVYWDKLIHSQPAGRYQATVIHDGEVMGGFNIIIPSSSTAPSSADNLFSCC